MMRRTCGAAAALVCAGTLLRFREACGIDAITATIGAVLLCGMAPALAFVRPKGGARPPIGLGIAALLAGTALALGVYTVRPAPSIAGVALPAGTTPVLCELIVGDGARSARLVASAMRAAETAQGEVIVVAYRASGFVRPGLAPSAAPAAFVDYARAADPEDLAAAIRTARTRPRIACALHASAHMDADHAFVVRAALDNANAEHAFRGEVFALLVRKEALGEHEVSTALAGAVLAQEASLPPGSSAGPWEARLAPPAGEPADTLEVLVVAADEFVQAVRAARHHGRAPSCPPPSS